MKKVSNILMLIIGLSVFAACSNSGEQEVEATTNANYTANTSLTVQIEGMSCAVGCAKTIQKAVSELPGVTFSEVNFDEQQGIFKYDDSQVKPEQIIDLISGMNEGAYKPTILGVDKEIKAAPEEEKAEEKVPA